MTRIAFLLLAHKDPQGVVEQARRLTRTGDYVIIHYDRRAPQKEYQAIRRALEGTEGVAFPARRSKCGWGEWSLVEASLAALRCAEGQFPAATHFYLISGDCMPIKSAEYAHAYLERENCDFIEAVDFFEGGWIKTGLRDERLIYRHWFNERRSKGLFYATLDLQKRLGLTRDLPQGIQIMIGSQWWCLRRTTVEAMLQLIADRPDLPRFFRGSWIPDETFFQSLVAHLVPRAERRDHSPTFLIFTDYGMPATFYNDHYDLLLRQDFLFARKISAEALELRERLGDLWQAVGQEFAISGEGPRLFTFLTGRGRVGRRFSPRFWATEAATGRAQCLHLVVAKKWYQAKRLTALIRGQTAIPALDFIFNEDEAGLPDLGGIASSLEKRGRHRRALVKLLFEEFGTPQLVLCVDPSALSLIRDFASERAETRVLFIDSDFDDAYLRGHMRRVGLINGSTPDDVARRLAPIVRDDLFHEVEGLQDLELRHFESVSSAMTDHERVGAISRFLGIAPEAAQGIVGAWDIW